MMWTREETLGKGGFGFVSKAKTNGDLNIPHVVAVKSTNVSKSESLSKEKQLLDRFRGCPYILRCFGEDYTTENGENLYNIILEYASGGCLADRIVQGKGMPEKLVKEYTRSMVTALKHIHAMGYVHCDIKPHNVLLVQETVLGYRRESAKLADFGSVTIRSDQMKNLEDPQAVGFRGTVLYAAPESIAREEYVPESDIWAVGCSILHMLTGKSPWKIEKSDKPEDVLFKIGCSDEIPEIDNKLSGVAKDFLKKCLVKNPRARFTASMLLDHPFLKITRLPGKRISHHHGLSSMFHSMTTHCFHVPSSTVHAC